MSDNPIFSYTKRDYEQSRREGLAKIPIISSGKWTDLNPTDPGIIILDYVHALVDMVNYYQDHQALEAFITTARERANIFRLAKQLSYSIRSATCAKCDVTFNSVFSYDHPIKIPKYTGVTSKTGIQYVTADDAYLPIQSNSIVISCLQGKVQTKTYQGTGVSRFSNSMNAVNQAVYLTATNIDMTTIEVTDNAGNVWTPVDYIVFSTEKDRVYQLELNPDNSITIKFGDGERGIVPQPTDTLTIKYITTDAEEGQISPNSIIGLVESIYDTDGSYVEFLVSNTASSVGGSTAQSSTEIRELAPGAIKAQTRAVTLSDFENLAKLVDGVADAKAYDINTKPDLCLYHEVKVLIIPKDEHADVKLLHEKVYNYLYQRMIPPTNLQILAPSTIYIDINVEVKAMPTVSASRLEYDVYSAIVSYFEDRAGTIGENFYPSDLSATIVAVEGVRYIVSIDPNIPVDISELSVAALGNVKVIVQ